MSNKDYSNVSIHESSYVDNDVEIGAGTKIWHFSHILQNCKIGKECSLGQNVVVGPNVKVGNKVKIQKGQKTQKSVKMQTIAL